jgi:hypothetical protein
MRTRLNLAAATALAAAAALTAACSGDFSGTDDPGTGSDIDVHHHTTTRTPRMPGTHKTRPQTAAPKATARPRYQAPAQPKPRPAAPRPAAPPRSTR